MSRPLQAVVWNEFIHEQSSSAVAGIYPRGIHAVIQDALQRMLAPRSLTVDEARHTVELSDAYVVLPEHPFWDKGVDWVDGRSVGDGFTYSSDVNDDWLSVDGLLSMIETGPR